MPDLDPVLGRGEYSGLPARPRLGPIGSGDVVVTRASPAVTSFWGLALVNVSESPEPLVFRPQPGRVGFEWTAASASPKQRCGVGGGSPVPRLIRVTGLLVVRAELVRRGQLPPGSRARPGPGRTEALEQWTESCTGYQRVGCGRSSCAAVKPSARA